MNTTQLAVTCAVAIGATTTLACTTTETEDSLPANAIPIAALVDQTGTSATLAFSGSIKLAFKQMNEGLLRSSQGGVQFRLMLRDTVSRTDLAVFHAKEAVRNGARALITEISADTIAVNALNYNDEPMHVPVNCFACSSSFINNPDPARPPGERDPDNWLHRLFMNSKFEAAVQMRVAMSRGDQGDSNGDGKFKVALIATDDPYGRGWDATLRARMKEMHPMNSSVEVVWVQATVNDTSYNWNSDLSKLVDDRNDNDNMIDGHPDTVFLALLPVGSAAATKAYREAEHLIPLQATTAFRRLHILRSLGAYADKVEGGSPQQADPSSGMDFVRAFKAEYGEDPEMLTSGSYDCAVTHMLAALVAMGTGSDPSVVTPDTIRASLDRINDPAGTQVGVGPDEFARAADIIRSGGTINYLGATGDTTFDKYGNTFPVMVHYKVDGKVFKEVQRFACTDEHLTCQPVE
jgi:hypothetical protein